VRRDEVCRHRTLLVTGPERTAYGLARRTLVVEAVVAVDALAHEHGFDPAAVLAIAREHLGARGSAQLAEVVRLADARAGSPMETRIRLALLAGGLPAPVLQLPVGPYLLAMAYPAVGLGIEYDGREHRTQRRAMRDLDRQAHLTAAGWRKVLRFPAATVLDEPEAVPRAVHAWLRAEARRRGTTPAALITLISAT
jgi:very-short-patch-repair endonuclease